VTQPHLLLLQKTMVMVEGLATQLHPDINMWDVSGPFVSEWMRDELGPEAAIARGIRQGLSRLAKLPALLDRIEEAYPSKGGAPEAPPLPEVALIFERGQRNPNGWLRYAASFLIGGVVAWLALEHGIGL